jgi:hypothetical protein
MLEREGKGEGLSDLGGAEARCGHDGVLGRGHFNVLIVMALGGSKTERMMRRCAAVTDATLRATAEAVSGRN